MFELPQYLKRYTVEQAYERYDAADQATWRFVMQHLYEHLREHAHPSYVQGIPATGLTIDRIPRITDVDAALQPLGWRAVPISGFIPPRAFQAFQAAGVLPVATEIRTPEHLAYTPAPDIIHEAAGHAPILVNQEYGSYLRRSGEVSRSAFSCPQDVAVYDAIAALSALKEQPATKKEQLVAAEKDLEQAVAQQTQTSESTRLARLYWWTAEYGLIGTPDEYHLYGAGLLSSLGEAHHCRAPAVKKIPLSLDALQFDYDITQPQPQLFVAKDFAHLTAVLEDARRELAAFGPLRCALNAAIQSQLPAQLKLSNECKLRGQLTAFNQDNGVVTWLQFDGPSTFIQDSEQHQRGELFVSLAHDAQLPFGPLRQIKFGSRSYDPTTAQRFLHSTSPLLQLPTQVEVSYASGARVRGSLVGWTVPDAVNAQEVAQDVQGAMNFYLKRAVVECTGTAEIFEHLVLPLGVAVTNVQPADDDTRESYVARHSPTNDATRADVQTRTTSPGSAPCAAPAPKQLTHKQQTLRALFAEATEVWQTQQGEQAVTSLTSIHQQLGAFPAEWLLRWNLLESLIKLGAIHRASCLVQELEALEVKHQHQQPIATGLRSLRLLAQASVASAAASEVR